MITFAWDITWYQYRINPESGQPVRIAERGHDSSELEDGYTGWNAHLSGDGRLMPDIERI